MSKTNSLTLLLITFLLAACSSRSTEVVPEPTVMASSTPVQELTLTPTSTEIVPTPTATLLPVTQETNAESEAGLIIFSMGDGEYTHLFAYHPSYLPITRLTGGAWDDDSPTINPKGTQLVFTSNRSGKWDIYILDLQTNSTIQITDTQEYESSPSWSPDGQWITYDVYSGTNYNIMIQSISDPASAPIQLTENAGNNFDPVFSPDGTQIAFVSDRAGRNEIWLASLNTSDNLFSKVIGNSDSSYTNPSWSPDGLSLAWTCYQDNYEIQIYQLNNTDSTPVTLGSGKSPVWMPDGSGILAIIDSPNQNSLVAYAVNDHHLMLPPIPVSGFISDYDWKAGSLSSVVKTYLLTADIPQPAALWAEQRSVSPNETGRYSLVPLSNVEAPESFLSDAADDSFNQFRALTTKKLGWDLLGILENASLSVTTESIPGIQENWLYTGRAFELNLAPFEAGWMVMSREDFNGETYWRIWVKCQNQDGSCGKPLKSQTWDFASRYSGDSTAYENGGKLSAIPAGYWLDFTELASRFGWERLPSENNWRSYFSGTRFNQLLLRQGLTWEESLRDLYPEEVVDLIMENQK